MGMGRGRGALSALVRLHWSVYARWYVGAPYVLPFVLLVTEYRPITNKTYTSVTAKRNLEILQIW